MNWPRIAKQKSTSNLGDFAVAADHKAKIKRGKMYKIHGFCQKIKKTWNVKVSLFGSYDISTFVGYLIPNPVLYK